MRKGVVHFVIFALLGAIINVAIAWYWILFVSIDFNNIQISDGDETQDNLPQYVFVRSDLFDFHQSAVMNKGYVQYYIFGTEIDSKGVDSSVPLYMHWETGWPVHSFDGSYFMTADGLEQSYAFHVPESLMNKVMNFYLPYRPILPGFLFNTALYGGIPWLLICGPFVLRRRLRHNRNQCTACGYPIGDSEVCTECGFALKRVASNAAK